MEIYGYHIMKTSQCHSYRGIISYIVKQNARTQNVRQSIFYTNYIKKEPLQLMKGV